jgi:hypothetical protein
VLFVVAVAVANVAGIVVGMLAVLLVMVVAVSVLFVIAVIIVDLAGIVVGMLAVLLMVVVVVRVLLVVAMIIVDVTGIVVGMLAVLLVMIVAVRVLLVITMIVVDMAGIVVGVLAAFLVVVVIVAAVLVVHVAVVSIVAVAAVLIVHMAVIVFLFFLIHDRGVHLHHALQAECVEVQDLFQGSARLLGLDQSRKGVHRLDAVLHVLQLFFIHEIQLVENDAVGEGNLLLGLVHIPVGTHLIQVNANVLRVNQAHHTVDAVVVLDEGVAVESENDRGRIGQASGLNDDRVEVLATASKHSESAD